MLNIQRQIFNFLPAVCTLILFIEVCMTLCDKLLCVTVTGKKNEHKISSKHALVFRPKTDEQ